MTFKEPSKIVTAKVCPSCSREFSPSGDDNVCPHDQSLLSLITADPFIGSVVANHYLVTDVLGQGGWSVVYRAQHQTIKNRQVAIKILHSHLVRDKEKVLRFQREAEAVMSLSHPQIASVYDYGVLPEGQPFIVMEYLEGTALNEILEEHGAQPVDRVIRIGKLACLGLSAAHEHGLVHRDVKPSNIFIAKDAAGNDLVKILDFGLAKIVDAEHAAALTQTGETMGTPDYMSPEQCLGVPVDARTDLYTLGYVLYEAATGKRPVRGSTAYESMKMHIEAMPAPFAVANPEARIPDALEAVIFKALAKDPYERYQTALEMRDALERASQEKEHALFAFQKMIGIIKRQQSYSAAKPKKELDWFKIVVPLLTVVVLGVVAFRVNEITQSANRVIAAKNADKLIEIESNNYYKEFGTKEGNEKKIRQLFRELIAQPNNKEIAVALAQTLNNQTFLSILDAKYDEAAELNEQALDIETRLLGKDHPEYAKSLSNQATMMMNSGRAEEAGRLYRESLAIREKALGPSSPMVARSLRNLADYYRRTGRAKEAVPLLKRAIAIYENTLGSASTEYLWCMDLLGITYTDLGNYKEAEHWLYPAYDMRLKAGGKDDPDYARALSNLGKLNYLRQEYVIAEKQLSVALSIFESKLGANSRDTGLTAMNLAEVYLRTNRLPEAEKYFRQAYTALKAVEPLSDNRIAATHKLMEVLEKLSKHDEAFALEEELTP